MSSYYASTWVYRQVINVNVLSKQMCQLNFIVILPCIRVCIAGYTPGTGLVIMHPPGSRQGNYCFSVLPGKHSLSYYHEPELWIRVRAFCPDHLSYLALNGRSWFRFSEGFGPGFIFFLKRRIRIQNSSKGFTERLYLTLSSMR